MRSGAQAPERRSRPMRLACKAQDQQGSIFSPEDHESLEIPAELVNLGDDDLMVAWLRRQAMEE